MKRIHPFERIIRSLFLVGVAILVLVPLYSLLLASLRPSRDLLRYGITLQALVPKGLDFSNFIYLFTGDRVYYGYWFRNSLYITALQTAVSCYLSSMVAYGLSIYRFRGRGLIFALVLFLLMVPLQILILPLYKLMIGLRLMNTVLGVILPFAVSPFATFFFFQYMRGISRDFIDAGRVDGVGEFGIFIRIVTPIMKPALGAMVIFQSLQAWNNYLWPLIVLRDNLKFTIPIGLNSLLTPYGNNYDVLISGAVLATVPIILIFVIFQKYFIAGLTAGGVKG
ncbi:MAG: carbohydrate ABC transporter permease [Spirochaetaceae bacterium]|nr:carbohydrate ABC transporter permease [Spirochaetaceae bacterium]